MKHFLTFQLSFVLLLTVTLTGCRRETKSSSPPEVKKPKVENDLAFVTLSKKARASLQIQTMAVGNKEVQEHAEYTGWVMVPQGKEITLTASVSGHVLKAQKEKPAVMAGQTVKAEEELIRLDPVLTPVEEIQMAALKRDVASELTKAQTSLKVAETDLNRLQDLLKQGLRGQQDVDKAQEKFDHAQENLKAAQDKQKLFGQPMVTVKAPLGGKVLTVNANPGEFVSKGAPLFTLADLTQLWVRVPIPEYDLPGVKIHQPALVALKGNKQNGGMNETASGQKPQDWNPAPQTFSAKPVTLVPQVDVQKHTIDLIYDLPAGTNLVKDQMVTVFVPLGQKKTETVIPYSAVVYDSQGGTWIYLDRSKKGSISYLYERRRVQLGPAFKDGVALRPTLTEGDLVVSSGAGALFSSEFHSTPVHDDDDD